MNRFFNFGNSRYKIEFTKPPFMFIMININSLLLGISLTIQLFKPDDSIQGYIYLGLFVYVLIFLPFKYVGEKNE